MKIFIFGSNSMLGTYLSNILKDEFTLVKFTRDDYDLSLLKIDTLKNLLLNNNFKTNDIVINFGGVIPQSSKQRSLNTNLYFKINSLFPVILSLLVEQLSGKMIHITTDCVFSGKDGNYNENSIHDETNNYGTSKSLGELCNATIIRTSVIGEELTNKRQLLEWIRSNKGKEINGYENHYWNGVTCLQLAHIIRKMISGNIWWDGVRHIFSPNKVSKYDLANIINETYNLNIKINKFKTEKLVDKSIESIYKENNLFNIPDIKLQIKYQKEFKLN